MARSDLKAKIRLEGDASGADQAIKKTEGRFKRMTSSIKANALKITAALASVVVAFREIEASAEKVAQREALQRNLAAQGIAIDEYIGKLKALSDNQIATADLIINANRAIKLGIEATDLPGLLEVAANASVELGLNVTDAFRDLVDGLGRASPEILDNLAIVIDSIAAYETYAKAVGTTVVNLTKKQKTLALTTAILNQAGDQIGNFAEKQSELTRAINRGRAAFENLKEASGNVLGGLVQMTAGGIVTTTIAISLLIEGIVKLARAMVAVNQIFPLWGRLWNNTAEVLKKADDGLDSFQQRAAQLAEDLAVGGVNLTLYGLGIKTAGEEAEQAGARVANLNRTIRDGKKDAEEAEESFDDLSESFGDARGSAEGLGRALESVNGTIRNSIDLVIRYSTQFDALAQSIGRAAAVQAALRGGATLSSDGRRINFPQGGSRFTTEPGLFPGPSGGTFTFVNQNVRQLPNGRVVVD